MLETYDRVITDELKYEKAQLQDKVFELQARLESLRIQLSSTETELLSAKSITANLDAKVQEAEKKVYEMGNKLQESEKQCNETRRKYEQANKRWNKTVVPGYRELKAEHARYRKKLSKRDGELAVLQLKAAAARNLMKEAKSYLGDDKVVAMSRASTCSVSFKDCCRLEFRIHHV